MRLAIILIFCFTSITLAGEINGVVRSSLNGAPVIGANVVLENTEKGAATNYQGRFSFSDLPAGEYILEVSFVGFRLPDKIRVSLGESESRFIRVELEEDILEGSEIVVTGTRTRRLIKDSPVSTEVIHADEINNIGAENVGEVLEERAGIIVTQDGVRGGLLSAQLQGLEDNHTLVLIDGAPVIGRIAGALDLSRVSVQNIERIEIIKGAASALYGSEAVGGVINIITKNPEQKFDYAANLNMGSFNARNIKLETSTARETTSLNLSLENHKADGYDLDPGTANTTADDFNNYSVFGKVRHQMAEDLSLQASGEYFTQRQEGFDGGDRITDTRNWYLNLSSEWQLKDYSKFNFRLYHTNYVKDINRAGTQIDQMEILSRAEFIYNRVIDNHILTFGGEATTNSLETNRIDDGNKKIYNGSFYAQDEIFYRTLEFNLGVRADYHSEFGYNFSPKFGLLYKPGENWRFRGSYSQGFRAPDFIELYLVLDHSGLTSQPYIAYGNPDLKPETSNSINIGAEYHFNSDAIIKLNFFNNHLKDMINSKFLNTSPEGIQYYTYENLTDAYTRGLEADFIYRFWSYFRLTGGYALTKTRDVASGKPFFNRPENSARLKFDWNFEEPGFSGNVRWRYIGERRYSSITGEETTAPWYAVWNARVEQRVYDPISVYFGIDNIFDYQNRLYVALPGRMIYAGIQIN